MEELKFSATQELGKLAKWLRILGYDCVYYDRREISDIIIQALRENRILLTRSSLMTKYKGVKAVIIRHDGVEDQLNQIKDELGLEVRQERFFTRCVECNVLLEEVDKEKIKNEVPGYVFETQEVFKKCPACGKVFWKGTHWDMVEKWLKGAVDE